MVLEGQRKGVRSYYWLFIPLHMLRINQTLQRRLNRNLLSLALDAALKEKKNTKMQTALSHNK